MQMLGRLRALLGCVGCMRLVRQVRSERAVHGTWDMHVGSELLCEAAMTGA